MARTKRSTKLDTRSARQRLELRREPHWVVLEPGRALGYRRTGRGGNWIAKYRDLGTSTRCRNHSLGPADDYADADGLHVLNYGQAQAKARNWFAEVQQRESGEPIHSGPFKVADALRGYFEHREGAGKKNVPQDRRRASLHIEASLGSIEVARLTRMRLESWRDALAQAPVKVKGGLGRGPKDGAAALTREEKRARRASANRVLAILKAALTWAHDRGLCQGPDDAWRTVKPFRGVEEARQEYLRPDEQVRLLNSIREPDFKQLVAGALFTGARYGELTRMQVGDFDPNPEGVPTVLVREGKDGKFRRCILTPEGRGYFEGLTAGRPKNELIFMKTADPRLLTVKSGELSRLPWGAMDQGRRMERACDAAGLPRMGFHQLRHSYASALVTGGMPLAMVAKLTGHADTRMLERHYAHLAPSDLSRALEALAPKLGVDKPNISRLGISKRA